MQEEMKKMKAAPIPYRNNVMQDETLEMLNDVKAPIPYRNNVIN